MRFGYVLRWARSFSLVLFYQLRTRRSPPEVVGGRLAYVVARRVR